MTDGTESSASRTQRVICLPTGLFTARREGGKGREGGRGEWEDGGKGREGERGGWEEKMVGRGGGGEGRGRRGGGEGSVVIVASLVRVVTSW